MSQRLGLYVDGLFRTTAAAGDGRVLTNFESFPFLGFACEVGRHAEHLVLFGRAAPADRDVDFELPAHATLVALPYYPSQRHLGHLARATPRTLTRMWRGVADVDVVWIFGPHPLAVAFAVMARLRGRRVVLGVRQDTMRYFRSRLPGRWATPLLAPLWLTDRVYRVLARRMPTTVVGRWLEEHYDGPRRDLLAMTVSLMRSGDVVAAPSRRDWSGEIELLTVGRIEPEKNPRLLLEAIADLERADPGRYRLRWVGTGRLLTVMRERARELGIDGRVSFEGYVPFGPRLRELYVSAHLFVHVSLTEGLPQVLLEAAASGLPIVATDVGGVAGGLAGGEAGLLVPPNDRAALVHAIRRMTKEEHLRRRYAERALGQARASTLDVEAERVAAFVLDGKPDRASAAAMPSDQPTL